MGTNRLEQWVEAQQREGQRVGESSLLLRQLQRRFGALPDGVTDRVRNADIAELDEWGLSLLDAPNIDKVFEPTPATRSGAV